MFENELQDLRRHKWRVDTPTRAVFTADDAREFLHNVGFCLEYPLRAPVLAPTFIGAVIGSDQNLPTAKYAFIHPRAKEANEFKDRLLREKSAFEAGFGEDDNLLISALEFPYFYALIGDRNPKVPPSAGERGERRLLTHAFELIQEHGPILETDLRERLGETVSDVALSRTLSELRQKLRIVRIEETGGAKWDLLMRWSPQMVNQGKQISAQEALSALVSKYLETCVAAEQKDVEEFFGHIVPRSRVAEVIKALLSAREFGFIQVNSKTLLRNTPRLSAEEKAAQIAAAAAPKPEGRANRSFRPPPEGAEPKKNVWVKYGPKQDRFDKREERTWKKAEGGARPSASAPKREWKKSDGPRDAKKAAPKRPWQKKSLDGKPAGERAPAERSFAGGMRPPKKLGARPEWKQRDDSTSGTGPRPEWKKKAGGPRDWKKAGPKRPWQKKAEGERGEKASMAPAGERPPKRFGARPEWKTRTAGGPGDWKKAGPKRPWQKTGEGKEAGGAERPRKPASAGKPYQKSGPGGGFKKPFKKPFKKSTRPGGLAKFRPRRPE